MKLELGKFEIKDIQFAANHMWKITYVCNKEEVKHLIETTS